MSKLLILMVQVDTGLVCAEEIWVGLRKCQRENPIMIYYTEPDDYKALVIGLIFGISVKNYNRIELQLLNKVFIGLLHYTY